ncbi:MULTISPECIES: GntT/GntP/DsdX family permease [Klebsiella pneumoniae complex]|nr:MULTISPECIES: gluconate:H+ symporter [Klebsiella]HBZ7669806.1 permease DsdX [Klebsiella variicola subsp. variicola]MDP0789987.1 gluconate:H+ symporter [Klebsiella pneumoniae]UVW55985.1 GntP family permease [Klebsiella variicola]HBR7475361.1 permease DsdX [Klebsiella pneumoniae]HCB0644217.1 permease DsdX [Klebsiella variicola subsp. variicola]
MDHSSWLLLVLLASVVAIVLLIIKVRVHAFLTLIIACFGVGLGSGMSLPGVVDAIEKGIGGTLGNLIAIIGLGGILGKVLEESGGAERLAKTMLNHLGARRAHWVMAAVGAIAGIPVFFEVGFVLLIPLVYEIARQTKMNLLYLSIPLALSLMTIHCILPPHPAAMAITVMLNADVGKVILYGFLVGIPTMIVSGPLWVKLVCKKEMTPEQEKFLEARTSKVTDIERKLPGFGITLFTICLPLILMVLKTLTSGLPEDSFITKFTVAVGNPLTALLIALIFAFWALGLRQGKTMLQLLETSQRSFPVLATIVFVIGAGGAFNGVLIQSGVGKAISSMLLGTHINPIILAWFIAWIMHLAVGSATVAMISAASMISPMLAADPALSPELMVIAIGAGSIGWAHVTDSAFWIVREYLGISLSDALKKFTGATVLASLVALLATLALAAVL